MNIEMTTSAVRGAMKRRQMELDIQRVLDEEFSDVKRRKLCTGLITSNIADSSSTGSPTSPLTPLPQSQQRQIGSVAAIKSTTCLDPEKLIGPYRLLAPLEDNSNSKAFTAVDTRQDGRLMICRRLDRAKYERMMQLSHRISNGPEAVSLEEREENGRAYEQIFPPSSEFLTGDDGSCYYFEPKDFGSLHAYVAERKRLNEQECHRYFRQILRLIIFCHQRRVVLRDLKLRKFVFADAERLTIRLDGVEELFVCPDAGDESFNDDDDKISDRHGCPAYVGPEILDLSQKSYSGCAADMWSLGVLLYVILYGRYPFYDTTPARLFAKIRLAQLQVPDESGVSFEARLLIRCLLRRDPCERPSAVDVLAHPWLQSGDRFKNTSRRLGNSRVNAVLGVRLPAMDSDDQCVPCFDDGKVAKSNGKRNGRQSGNEEPAVPNQ